MGYYVVHRVTGQVIAHQNSPVESCDYDASLWLINPALPAGVSPDRYKVVGDEVTAMTDAEAAAAELPAAKAAKAAAVDSWYVAALAAGYPVADGGNGYALAAGLADQARFTADAVLQSQAVSAGLAETTDMVAFLDAAGVPHSLPIGEYLTLLVGYGQFCRATLIANAGLLGQVAAATTAAELDAITLP